LGCILFELAVGRPLFPHATEMELIAAIADGVGPLPPAPCLPAALAPATPPSPAAAAPLAAAAAALGPAMHALLLRLLATDPPARARCPWRRPAPPRPSRPRPRPRCGSPPCRKRRSRPTRPLPQRRRLRPHPPLWRKRRRVHISWRRPTRWPRRCGAAGRRRGT